MGSAPILLHASGVAIGGKAVLVSGAPGIGKSDLCLRLIDRGATLIADDQIKIVRRDDRLFAQAPDTIAGKMEARGLGIIEMPHVSGVPVAMEIALVEDAPRFPLEAESRIIAGLDVPLVRLARGDPSLAIKVELALARAGR